MSKISIYLNNNNDHVDVTSLTKRGIKRVLIAPFNDIKMDGITLMANKTYDITFPELNGTFPSTIVFVPRPEVTEWYCGCRIMELAGKGNANYFKIISENDNGVPTIALDNTK